MESHWNPGERSRRWRAPAGLPLALALLFSGCSAGPAEKAADTAAVEIANPEGLTIAMIAKSRENPFFVSARVGAQERARELSKELDRPIHVDWLTPEQEDAAEQARIVRGATEAGVEAILISCSDAAVVTPAIDAAVERGVAVMTFDSDAPQSRRFAFASVDNVAAGRRLMAALAERIGSGKVAVLAGNRNAPNLQERLQGVQEEVANHPGIEIVETVYNEETADAAAGEVLRVTAAVPDLRGWVMLGGWALYRAGERRDQLLALDPEKITFVAMDALPAQLEFVQKGLAPFLLAQPTYEWGPVCVNAIVDHLELGKEVPEKVSMELYEVTPDNLGEWAHQLREWRFTGIPADLLE